MPGHETRHETEREPFFHCDMCNGILIPMDARERDDLVLGQLVVAALCVLIGFVYLLVTRA